MTSQVPGLRDRLSPSASALIIVDVQNDFCHRDGKLARKLGDRSAELSPVLGQIRAIAAAARMAGVPITFAQAIYDRKYLARSIRLRRQGQPRDDDLCLEGSWGADFALSPTASDTIMVKHRFSAFHGTELEARLTAAERTTLIVCGVTTSTCVMATALDASFRDFYPVIAEDATWAPDAGLHAASLNEAARLYADVVPVAVITAEWVGAPD